MRAPKFDGPAHRFISWNVAGMRALMRKDAEVLRRLVEAEQVDAICLQVGALVFFKGTGGGGGAWRQCACKWVRRWRLVEAEQVDAICLQVRGVVWGRVCVLARKGGPAGLVSNLSLV